MGACQMVGAYHASATRLGAPPRIGLVRQFFYERADEEIRRQTDDVAQKLAEAGASVEEVGLPELFDQSPEHIGAVVWTEASVFHREWFAQNPEDYGPNIRRPHREAMVRSPLDYIVAQNARRELRVAMWDVYAAYNVLLSPGTTRPGAQRPLDDGSDVLPGAVDVAGLPGHQHPDGPRRERHAAGRAARGGPIPRGAPPQRRRLVRAHLGVRLTPIDPR